MNELYHASGWTKKNHKYIRKEGNRYIYPSDMKRPKMRKLVDRSLIDGKLERGAVSSHNNFRSRARKNTRKFYREADKQFDDYIKKTNDMTYDHLKESDDQFYKHLDNIKKQEDPKFLKRLLKTGINRMPVSKAKTLLSSKLFDKVTDILAKRGADLVKARNKVYIKYATKQHKKHKQDVAKQHKESLTSAKKQHNEWRNKGMKEQMSFFK